MLVLVFVEEEYQRNRNQDKATAVFDKMSMNWFVRNVVDRICSFDLGHGNPSWGTGVGATIDGTPSKTWNSGLAH